MSWRGLILCRGRDAPRLAGQCGRIPTPRHGRVQRVPPLAAGPRLLSVDAARYRVRTSCSTPCHSPPQESARGHPESAVKADDLTVEHPVVDDVRDQRRKLPRPAQA